MTRITSTARRTLFVGLLLFATARAFAQPVPGLKKKPVIDEICSVDRWSGAQCVSISQLRRLLSASEVDRLLETMQRLLDRMGLAGGSGALVECGRTPRPVVAQISPGTKPAKSMTVSLTASSLRSFSSRMTACAQRVTGFRGNLSGGQQSWIDDTVGQVDADLANCHDGGNSQIAQDGGGVTTERKVKGVIDRYTPAPPPTTPKGDPSVDNSALFVGTKGSGSSSGSGAPASPPPATDTTATTPPPPANPPSTTSPAPPWKEPSPSGIRRGTTSPCREGADCAPTCAEKQAGWERFKDSCEQSHWQAYPCMDFLRKVNGCVDASLINPGPEGDLTCPPRSRQTPTERMRSLWELNCKRRQMFVTPVPGGGEVCKRPEEPTPTLLDICNDPRAMPSQDQCTGPEGNDIPDSPAPRPQPDPRRPDLPKPGATPQSAPG